MVHADSRRVSLPSEPVSPELALVHPELGERARAQLPEREPDAFLVIARRIAEAEFAPPPVGVALRAAGAYAAARMMVVVARGVGLVAAVIVVWSLVGE